MQLCGHRMLPVVQSPVDPVLFQQLGVSPAFGDATVIDDQDLIGGPDSR